jgi:hypothetical protein
MTITRPEPVNIPHTYPYLIDNFFYTGANEFAYPPLAGAGSGVVGPFPATAMTGLGTAMGGPSGAGWFKMFEFFEVPSPVIGATGMVAQGNNFDWFRQDLKPGLLNLNLIIDEEVFLGLMGMDSSDSYQLAVLGTGTGAGFVPGQSDMQLNLAAVAPQFVPRIVTSLDANFNPFTSYLMPNQGAFVVTNSNFSSTPGGGTSAMKACFADFLRLRNGAGASNALFGLVGGTVIDRPFHSLSYPDINFTPMRPAYPPPLATVATPYPPTVAGTWPASGAYIQDPGVKNPYLSAVSLAVGVPPVQPPPIPTRRLFQIPDAYGSPVPYNPALGPTVPNTNNSVPAGANYQGPVQAPQGNTTFPPFNASNASVPGDALVNTQQVDLTNSLNNPYYDLTAVSSAVPVAAGVTPILPGAMWGLLLPTIDAMAGVGPVWLGNHNGMLWAAGNGASNPVYPGIYDGTNNTVNGRFLPVAAFQQADERQQPYFRSEWMQRVLNLSTVRTHQYAVWITIGFFEVVQPGNPQLAYSKPAQAYDQLGMEIGALEGKNTRYRGFFILDRTRATGFNPTNAGDFRDVIVYRKTIQ